MIASPRNKFVICLDTALLVIFILLLSPRLTGMLLHEVLGLIFFIPIIAHLLIAWPWIRNSTKKFFKTATLRTRINFFLNTILFILVITELVSGFFIFQFALPKLGIKTINDRSWRELHDSPLNFVVLFAGLHIAVNWGWIMSVFKKRPRIGKQINRMVSPEIMTIVLRACILIVATAIVASALYAILGQPSFKRSFSQDEVGRFKPGLGHGIVQILGETFLIALYAFIARKWFRIRL